MSWGLAIITLELVLFLIFLNRKSKLGRRITKYLMRRQKILSSMTMEDVDERLEEICKETVKKDKKTESKRR